MEADTFGEAAVVWPGATPEQIAPKAQTATVRANELFVPPRHANVSRVFGKDHKYRIIRLDIISRNHSYRDQY